MPSSPRTRSGRRRKVEVRIDGVPITAQEDDTVLQAARRGGQDIPTLCYVEGLSTHGGCRVCVVELTVNGPLAPACATTVTDEMEITTASPRLVEHRRQIVELLFAEGNHVCSVCVANGGCELQDLADDLDIDHIRFEGQYPQTTQDASHDRFVYDPGKCILCTRCVRACAEIEGAFVWDVAGRGSDAHLVTDMNGAWGDSPSCTDCGKCVQACPTGALHTKGAAVGTERHDPDVLTFLSDARAGDWHDRRTEVRDG